GIAENGEAAAAFSHRATDDRLVERAAKTPETAQEKRSRPPAHRQHLFARRGDSGNDLLLRPARQRALRAIGGRHRLERAVDPGARQGAQRTARARWRKSTVGYSRLLEHFAPPTGQP